MPSTLLARPHEFFSQRDPSLSSVAAIMFLSGVVAVASTVPYADQITPDGLSTSMLALSVVIGAVGILVISTSLVYLLSALAGGSGSLTNLVTNIGWSSLPLLFVNFLSTAVLWTLASLGQLLPLTGQQSLSQSE